jgi:hypothetical protein
MNPSASAFVPKWVKTPPVQPRKARFTKAELKAIQAPALQSVAREPRVAIPPFHGVPASLQSYLNLRNYIEFVDIEAATRIVETVSPTLNPLPTPPSEKPTFNDPVMDYYCVQCSKGPQPCGPIGEIVRGVRRREQQNLLGAFLFQQGEVVMGQVATLLVFDSKRSSMRMRKLKEQCPQAIKIIKEFLCGEGFHIPPPPVTAHDQWRTLNQMLKFDSIRDSKTIIYTELSKYWKKSHTPFEQFAHFLFYRDDAPAHRSKNMITHAQKPVLVAVLSGDLDAVVMLSELGFFVPPDYYWSFPFFKDALRDARMYNVMRHLCIYYYQKQSERGESKNFKPISPRSQRPEAAVAAVFKPKTALEALIGAPQQ